MVEGSLVDNLAVMLSRCTLEMLLWIATLILFNTFFLLLRKKAQCNSEQKEKRVVEFIATTYLYILKIMFPLLANGRNTKNNILCLLWAKPIINMKTLFLLGSLSVFSRLTLPTFYLFSSYRSLPFCTLLTSL